ncbi:MFS transporter [Chitinimonas lacunae]|uniref:MFS transporter n=1 Tax=Chitinimonas lacunae TaxID=1963018 RepID=A0ABV8MNA4_9NEIS
MFRSVRDLPRNVLYLVFGRAISSLGSALTGFALNVWLYQQTGSYTMFAMLAVVNAIPGLIFSPIAGVLVDRYPKKSLLMLCDVVSALSVAALGLASLLGELSPLLLAVSSFFLSLTRAISWPAAWAAISSLTDKAQRPGVNGISEALNGGISIFSPMLGALLFELIGISGIALFDIVSYGLCIALLFAVRFPPETAKPVSEAASSPFAALLNDCLSGFRWIRSHAGLSRLLLYFVVMNLGCSVFAVLYAPYVLSFSSENLLGICMALGGSGMIAGGLFYAVIGNKIRSESAVLMGGALVGISMIGFGIMRSPMPLALCAFFYSAGFAAVNGASQTIWQTHVPLSMQGRVFSVRRMIAFGLNPLSVLISVPFIQAVLEPLLTGKIIGLPVGYLWGTGPTAPLGLMASLCGLLCVSVALLMFLFNGLRMQPPPVAIQPHTS